jgi:hypothetical protein
MPSSTPGVRAIKTSTKLRCPLCPPRPPLLPSSRSTRREATLRQIGTKLHFEALYTIWTHELQESMAGKLMQGDQPAPEIALRDVLEGYSAMTLGYGGLVQAWRKPGAAHAPKHCVDLKAVFCLDMSNNWAWTGKQAALELQARLERGPVSPAPDDVVDYEMVCKQVKHVVGYGTLQQVPAPRLCQEYAALLAVLKKLDTAAAPLKGLLPERGQTKPRRQAPGAKVWKHVVDEVHHRPKVHYHLTRRSPQCKAVF